jgi:hypothetical protein
MKKKTLRALFYASALIFALCCVQPAFAHGTEPRLEISVERINPGGIVEVRGVDFDYEESVELSLMRSEIQIPLVIAVTADVEGVFTQVITLPSDLPVGEYNFRAKSDHHLILSPSINVWGAAVESNEGNGIQDQSDVQFGPLPTFAPGVSSTPLPQTAALEPPASKESSSTLIYSILLGLAILALFSIRTLKK